MGAPVAASTPRPPPMPAQPVATRTTTVSLSAPITVHAPPGMNAREIAALIEQRLQALVQKVTPGPSRESGTLSGALYDY